MAEPNCDGPAFGPVRGVGEKTTESIVLTRTTIDLGNQRIPLFFDEGHAVIAIRHSAKPG
jgi:hypothetical protein